jgi:hypothetical protein
MKRQVTSLALAAALALAQIGVAAAQSDQGSNTGGMNQTYSSGGSANSGGTDQK